MVFGKNWEKVADKLAQPEGGSVMKDDLASRQAVAELGGESKSRALTIVPAKTKVLGQDFTEVYGTMYRDERLLSHDPYKPAWVFDTDFLSETMHLFELLKAKRELRFQHEGHEVVVNFSPGKKLPTTIQFRVTFPSTRAERGDVVHNYLQIEDPDPRRLNDTSVKLAGWKSLNGRTLTDERRKVVEGITLDLIKEKILDRG